MYLGHASNDSKYLKLLDVTAKGQFWLDLLHYKKNISSGYISDVKAVGFFFAPNGMNNPLGELNASIKAFYSKNIFE